jgi:hypothetical protein
VAVPIPLVTYFVDMQPIQILLIAALVIYFIVRRLSGVPLVARRLVLVPALLVILGLTQLGRLNVSDTAILVAEALVSFGLGALRGVTINLYEQAGHLWYRYRPVTVLLWVVSLAVRVLLEIHPVGTHLNASGLSIMLGISMLGEATIVAVKARHTGVPYAPDRRTARNAVRGRRS